MTEKRNQKGQFDKGSKPSAKNIQSVKIAMQGNENGLKLKEPDIRKQAYNQYCAWIAKGEPKEAWTFRHPELSCTYKTMEKYIKENPLEFPPLQKELAESESYSTWFGMGKEMMLGRVDKCQPAIYQMIMRNKFGWDKPDKTENSTTQPLVVELVNKIREE